MIERDLFACSITEWKIVYNRHIPQLVAMAEESGSAELFKEALRFYVSSCLKQDAEGDARRNAAARQILLLIEYDGTSVNDLSTGEGVLVQTITLLWHFLHDAVGFAAGEDCSSDLLVDLYHQFCFLHFAEEITPDRQLVEQQMSRWPTGLDEDVKSIRLANKERLMVRLVQKIEDRHASTSRFQFAEGLSYAEKLDKVREWWNLSFVAEYGQRRV